MRRYPCQDGKHKQEKQIEMLKEYKTRHTT